MSELKDVFRDWMKKHEELKKQKIREKLRKSVGFDYGWNFSDEAEPGDDWIAQWYEKELQRQENNNTKTP